MKPDYFFNYKGLVVAGIAAAVTFSGLVENCLGIGRQRSAIQEPQSAVCNQTRVMRGYSRPVTDKGGVKRGYSGPITDRETAEQRNAITMERSYKGVIEETVKRTTEELSTRHEEIIKETIKSTTQELTIRYDEVIKSVFQEAQKQVDELLRRQRSLEDRLITVEASNEKSEKDTDNETLKQIASPVDNYNGPHASLATQIPDVDTNTSSVSVDSVISTSTDAPRIGITRVVSPSLVVNRQEYLEHPQIEAPSAASSIESIVSNTKGEDRMRMLGDSNSVDERIKPKYMEDGFWTYAGEFGNENKKNFSKGPLGLFLGLGGIVYQGVIVLNKVAETILIPPAKAIGAGLSVIGKVSGLNPNATSSQGALYGKKFVKRVGANSWGGRNLTDADGNLVGAAGSLLTLHPKAAGRKLKRGLAIPTECEEGWFDKSTAEGVYIINHILPFMGGGEGEGHHLAGGIERTEDIVNGGITRQGN